MKKTILILGGGASGLAAAVIAAENGADVTVLEKNDRVGKKLLATGNGRCNLANMGEMAYYGDALFAREVMKALPAAQVLAFFDRIGLPTRADGSGRVYPACNQAAAVLDVLRERLQALQVRVETQAEARHVLPAAGGYRVLTGRGEFRAARVLICCGGLAAPKLGAANAYGLLTENACRLITPAPALSPLETEKAPLRGLSGLRLAATLALCDGTRPVCRTQGEVLFADYGLSGVCAMQLARDAWRLLCEGKSPCVYVDFSPALGLGEYRMCRLPPASPFENETALREWLGSRRARLPGQELLLGALPRVLRERLREAPPERLPRLLCAYPLRVTGVRGFDQAQVTQGGIDTADFDPHTLEHRRRKGLYACGEILNVDGDCGGYNLMFAFASGLLAGRAAAAE